MERRGGIELQEGAGGLPHAWPANTHYKATPLPTTSGFLRYFRACSLSPVRQGTPRVPQGTWGVLWERNVCPYWMLMEFPISPYVVMGLLAHIPKSPSIFSCCPCVLSPTQIHTARIPWNFPMEYGFHGISMEYGFLWIPWIFFSQLVKSAPQQPWPKKYDMDF